MLVCLMEFNVQNCALCIDSAEIWRPHREEMVVLAMFSALILMRGGGKIDQQKFKRSWRNSSR